MATDVERAAAVAAVRAAAELCARTQGRLVDGQTLTKGDDSPVTVADFAAQAIVAVTLTEALGTVDLVGEEQAADLTDESSSTLLDGVAELVRGQRGHGVGIDTVLEWIAVGGASGTSDRYWTVDPIDGTKGFLRGDQYAIALALIEEGDVTLGVLGCPNLPNADGSSGAIFVADGAGCEVYVGGSPHPSPVRVSHVTDPSAARLCESVESSHSDHDQAARIAARLGIAGEPYRIDSQCKYGAVARGDASIYLRLPTRAEYREKIWDHAAGKFVVECAGGRVTDVTGAPLDFGHGRHLDRNRGIVATNGRVHDAVVEAVLAVLAID